MNILFVIPNSPYESTGGIERHILNLIEYFRVNKKYITYIMLPTSGKNYTKTVGSITIFFSNSMNISNDQKMISEKAHIFSGEIENIILERKIDIICAENFHLGLPPAYSLLLNMVAGLQNIPLVLRLHSFAKTELQVEIINQLMWKKISCVSKSVTGDCFHKGTVINCLSTDYLGVNTNIFNQGVASTLKKDLDLSAEHKIILTATRILRGRNNILKEKGLINLIQAFSKIAPRYPKIRLLIAVAKPPKRLQDEFDRAYEMLVGYLKVHGVQEMTIIRNFELDEMPMVYRESDVFVLPSENETFGQVFTEAMSSGIPVIGTKVGGVPEIISDLYNGYLVEPNDSSILAQKIEILINDEQVRNNFIKAGLKTVSNKFTLEKQFDHFVLSLEEVLNTN
jgi:glycosyltransferase involved in cell wall biosynthesis